MYLTRYRFTMFSIVLAVLFAFASVHSYNVGEIHGARACVTAAESETPYLASLAGRIVLVQDDPSMGMSLATPAPAATPLPEPTDVAGAAALIAQGIALVREGGPGAKVGIAFILMGLIFFGRKFLPGVVPPDWTAELVLGFTALSGFAGAVAIGANPIDAALAFLLLGSAAIGMWEGIIKKLYRAYKRWKAGKEEKPVIRGAT